MALPEACGLWIEQRVQEELDAKKETGASLREIGRSVAKEVEKYFETKVSPTTISMKASRIAKKQSVTNVTPKEKPIKSKSKPKLEKLEKKNHGGSREGAGRKQQPFDHAAASDALICARVSISQLEKIRNTDPFKMDALIKVEEWRKKREGENEWQP